jgi:hypothetical protein
LSEEIEFPGELEIWAESLKVPVQELQGEYESQIEKLSGNHPEWNDDQVAGRALKITFSFAKSLRRSRAKPYDIMVIGMSGVRDMNAGKRNRMIEMYIDETTREAALAGIDEENARVKVLINQESGKETPIVVDTREFIEWEEAGGKKRRAKNRYFGKELPILPVRDMVAVGMKSFPDGDEVAELQVIRISAMRGPAEQEPPMWVPIRTRLNIRSDLGIYADARTAQATTWGTKVDVGWVADDIDTLQGKYDFLGGMPDIFQVPDLGEELDAWHELNADDWNRFCIVEGDIAFLATEPNATGNYSLAIEDMEAFDLEADATQGFLPGELYEYVEEYAEGTHVRAIVRTNKSDVWDSEKNAVADPDPETGEIPQRIQFNYLMVVPDPDNLIYREEFDEADEIEYQE